jgi:hypothetical protein
MYVMVEGAAISTISWSKGIIFKLLEVIHKQWLYRCIQFHDNTHGILAATRMEELQKDGRNDSKGTLGDSIDVRGDRRVIISTINWSKGIIFKLLEVIREQ